jgi:high affinity Mn2+ porin
MQFFRNIDVKKKQALLGSVFCFLYLASYGFPKDSIHKDTSSKWSFHFQVTAIDQYHGTFHAPYSGKNSLLDTTEQDMSVTSTIYLGRSLWKYAAIYANPEISGGKGFSGTTGIAGFPNGEIYRVGNPVTQPYVARLFFQQSFALHGGHDSLYAEDMNQVQQLLPSKRITLNVGRFSLADYFDNNPYSHDARSQFMNWVLMDNGAWDYPANTRGYTYGAVLQLIEPTWYIDIADAMEPRAANGSDMDPNVTKTFGVAIEGGVTYKVKARTGSISLLLFMNQTRAPYYQDAITAYENGNNNALNIDNDTVYAGNKKYGIGLSFNHPLGKYIGFFIRAGWNDGQTGDWAFTEVDQTLTPGFNFDGAMWHRKTDNFGIAYIINGISQEHRNFDNIGGYQFIIGDGSLQHYGNELILETYYQAKFFEHMFLAVDYQYVQNPAYNMDRGPVSIGSVRVHMEF